MIMFKILLVIAYIYTIIRNYQVFINNKKAKCFLLLAAAFSTFMLCGSHAANLDWEVTELDVSGYRTLYEQYDILDYHEFSMYPIFYGCMYVGQTLGISYRMWWAVMSVLAMSVIFFSCKIHKYSFSLCLATFMSYYEIVFYSGFKFFYGFCFLLLAYGFLIRNTRKGQLLFSLCTLIACGFHVMYFLFFILLIKPLKRPKTFVSFLVAITLTMTVMMRLGGSVAPFITPFLSIIDNEHVTLYTQGTVRLGFYVAVIINLTLIYAVYKIRQYKVHNKSNTPFIDSFYYSTLLSILYFPLYAVGLTFMRLLTAFSLVVITASSSLLQETKQSRLLCAKMSGVVVLTFWLMQFLTNIGSTRGFFETSLIPFFNVL